MKVGYWNLLIFIEIDRDQETTRFWEGPDANLTDPASAPNNTSEIDHLQKIFEAKVPISKKKSEIAEKLVKQEIYEEKSI